MLYRAVADLLLFNLAIAFGFLVSTRDRRHRTVLLCLIGLFVAGVPADVERCRPLIGNL